MSFLSRDAILGADDFEYESVNLPEWGGEVRVRAMTAQQRARWEGQMAEIHQSNKGFEKFGQAAIQIVVWCVVDEDGKPVFTDKDVAALGRKSSAPISRIREVVMRLSKMGPDDVEAAEEDFTETPGNDSSTD